MVWNVNVREFRPENEFLEVFLGLHGGVFGCWNREEKREKRKQEKKVEVWFEFGFFFPGLVLVLVWGNIEMRIKK